MVFPLSVKAIKSNLKKESLSKILCMSQTSLHRLEQCCLSVCLHLSMQMRTPAHTCAPLQSDGRVPAEGERKKSKNRASHRRFIFIGLSLIFLFSDRQGIAFPSLRQKSPCWRRHPRSDSSPRVVLCCIVLYRSAPPTPHHSALDERPLPPSFPPF